MKKKATKPGMKEENLIFKYEGYKGEKAGDGHQLLTNFAVRGDVKLGDLEEIKAELDKIITKFSKKALTETEKDATKRS